MTGGLPLVRRLLELVDAMAADLDRDALLQQISQSAQELFDAAGAAWCRLDGDTVTIVTAAGLSSDLRGMTYPLRGSAVDALISTGARSLVDRAGRFPHLNDRIYTGPEDRVAVGLTTVAGAVTGALYVTLLPDDVFGPDELEVLELLASHVGMALHHSALYEQAERARQDQEVVLASASHELRTPLTVLRGYGQTLLRHWDVLTEDERRELVERMLSRTEGMTGLVEQILQASAAGLSAAQVPPEVFDLAAAVTAATRVLSGASDRHPLTVDARGPVPALGRPECVQTVLDQLVENAVKYSPDGGPVEVTVRAEPGAAVMSVADRGTGIAPQELERVFERFVREAAVDGPSGAGLGLWIVRRTVEAQGGSVAATPRPGGGTVVHVRLPRGAA